MYYEQGDPSTAVPLYIKAYAAFSEAEGCESESCGDVGYNMGLAYEDQAAAAADRAGKLQLRQGMLNIDGQSITTMLMLHVEH